MATKMPDGSVVVGSMEYTPIELPSDRAQREEVEDDCKFKAGDLVRQKRYPEKTHTLTTRQPQYDDHGYGKGWGIEGKTTWIGEDQIEIIQPELKVGDWVRLLVEAHDHDSPKGYVAKIIKASKECVWIIDKVGDSTAAYRSEVEKIEPSCKACDRGCKFLKFGDVDCSFKPKGNSKK